MTAPLTGNPAGIAVHAQRVQIYRADDMHKQL